MWCCKSTGSPGERLQRAGTMVKRAKNQTIPCFIFICPLLAFSLHFISTPSFFHKTALWKWNGHTAPMLQFMHVYNSRFFSWLSSLLFFSLGLVERSAVKEKGLQCSRLRRNRFFSRFSFQTGGAAFYLWVLFVDQCLRNPFYMNSFKWKHRFQFLC